MANVTSSTLLQTIVTDLKSGVSFLENEAADVGLFLWNTVKAAFIALEPAEAAILQDVLTAAVQAADGSHTIEQIESSRSQHCQGGPAGRSHQGWQWCGTDHYRRLARFPTAVKAVPQDITTQGGANVTTEGGAPLATEPGANMNVFQGSIHILSAVNLKDAGGNPLALPAGVLPKFVASSGDAGVMGTQNADGSQPFTFSKTFTGNATFTGTVTYASGTVIKLTPVTVTVVVAEIASGDVAIT